jgi:putative ABC transport system permease protein
MMSDLIFRLRALFRSKAVEADLDDELRFHIEREIQKQTMLGAAPSDAVRRSRIQFGGIEQIKEHCRDARGVRLFETLWQDIRYGARMLAKLPALTAIVVITLSLGIGANVAIFGILNSVLLRPLPVANPDQIVAVAIQQQNAPVGSSGFSYPAFRDFRDQTKKSVDLFGSAMNLADFSADEKAEQVAISFVTANYFSALGIAPAVGRLILSDEAEEFSREPVIVLGNSYWQKRFGSDPAVIGKRVRVNGNLATIVGVVPKEFYGTYSIFEFDGYMPLGAMSPKYQTDRNSSQILAFGRLKPNVTLPEAQNILSVVAARLAQEYPATDKWTTVRIVPERMARPQPYANNGVVLMGSLFLIFAGLVLLLACTNVMNILLTRASARQGEMALRAALGANRARLIRQMLTEGFLLAILGAGGGIALGEISITLVRFLRVPKIRMDFSFDWRVYAYAFVAAALAGIFSSLSPAIRASRADVNRVLHEGARSGSGGKHSQHVRGDLVVAQVAFSVMLLIVAGLFVRSLGRAQKIDLGFDQNNVLNVVTDPREPGFDQARTSDFYRELETRVRALPSVQSVSLATSIPIGDFPSKSSVHIEGWPSTADQQIPRVLFNAINAGYFATMRVPLLQGRAFDESDNATAPLVAIVNQTMAKKFWPNEGVLGKRFSTKNLGGPFMTIVGVTQDGKYSTIAEDPQPYFYVPLKQNYNPRQILQIRSSAASQSIIPEVQQLMNIFAPDVPILNIQTMQQSLEGGTGFFTFRLVAALASFMGVIGLILAVVGVYGVVSFAVSQRTHEIGIRMALGASRRDIFGLIFTRGFKLVLVGVLAGVVAAWLLTRAMTHVLVGVSASDAFTFVVVALTLTVVALAACYVPARRAMRVDPIVALRHE